MPGRLIICATPIGNLSDASPRLAETLAAVDVIFAEDTRRTGKLLRHLGLRRPQRSFFVGNEDERLPELEARLEKGEVVALVTDAGTPAVSDPGVAAVQAARRVDASVEVVPGPSAVTTAIAVSGFSGDRFVFEGFLPRRGVGRRQRLAAIAAEERTVVLFLATRRVATDLAELAAACGGERRVLVARELTKLHEELAWSTLSEAATRWASESARGEYTIVVEGVPAPAPDMETALAEVKRAHAGGVPLSTAVREAAVAYQVSRRALYEAALDRDQTSSEPDASA